MSQSRCRRRPQAARHARPMREGIGGRRPEHPGQRRSAREPDDHGERLVLTRNQLMQICAARRTASSRPPLQHLSHVTTELQEGVMKTRMQPIGNAWAKLPRIVRDLALELDKKVDLRMLGAETELDRQVLEMIKDPLTHMVRNSADHGIELPADRVRAGKPEQGTITSTPITQGGHIVLEISDDGRGLALDKIKKKAVASGWQARRSLPHDRPADPAIHLQGRLLDSQSGDQRLGRWPSAWTSAAPTSRRSRHHRAEEPRRQGSSFIIKIPSRSPSSRRSSSSAPGEIRHPAD